jgi:hypothetical protein
MKLGSYKNARKAKTTLDYFAFTSSVGEGFMIFCGVAVSGLLYR